MINYPNYMPLKKTGAFKLKTPQLILTEALSGEYTPRKVGKKLIIGYNTQFCKL